MKDTQFSALVERLYEAALEPAEWPVLLHDLSVAFGGVGGNFMNLAAATPLIAFSAGLAESVPLYDGGWWQHDLFANHARAHGIKPGLNVCSDYFAPEVLARDMFQQEFQRRHGIGDVLANVGAASDGTLFAMSIQRRTGLEPPNTEERRLYGLIGRHFQRAVEIGLRVGTAEATSRALADRLARFDCAVAVVDAATGRVLQSNALLATLETEGVRIRHGRLALERKDCQAALDKLLHRLGTEASDKPAASVMPIPRATSLMPLLLHAAPLDAGLAERQIGPAYGRAALVTILRPDGPGYPPHAQVLAALGLTPGQARFALAIGAGQTVHESAEQFGVSDETARTMVKQIYARLGISRQSHLSRLMTLLSPFGD